MIVIHKKTVLAVVLGTTLLVAGYVNYISQPLDVSGTIKENSGEADFVTNMQKDIGEVARSTNNTVDAYFVSAKLEKELTYDKLIEYNKDLILDNGTDQSVKTIAQGQINSATENMTKEMTIETLLEAKGFENVLAVINDKNVNVIVKTQEELNVAQIAQIQSIVMREASAKAENIHIIVK